MRYVSATRGLRTPRLLRLSALAALLAAICAVMGMTASGAKAEPVNFQFDRGVINLGGEEEGLWAKFIDPDLVPPDAPSTIQAEVAGDGTLTAQAADFFFPPKRIEDLETGNALLPFVDANVAITADGDLSGTFDTATGDASIVLPADILITVYSAGSPSSVARCRVDGFNLTLATTGEINDPGDPTADPPRDPADYAASPMAPPSGVGAVIAPWAGLPASQVVGGSLGSVVCPALDDMLGGPGAIWLSGGTVNDVTVPLPSLAPQLTGTPATSTEQTSAEFKFEAGEGETSPVTGFECKLDTGVFEDCSSGTKSYTGLAVGSHTFTVRATNSEGAGPESAAFNWQVTQAEVCPPGTTGTPPNCQNQGKAKLGAPKVMPKKKSVKRGKKATFKVRVANTGNAAAKNVKVCVNAPKRFVKLKKCVNLKQIGAKKAKVAKFKVTVKKKARKGKKLTLKFKATSGNAGKKNAKATIKVK